MREVAAVASRSVAQVSQGSDLLLDITVDLLHSPVLWIVVRVVRSECLVEDA